ncbi:MAG: hypothetical protein M1840_007723 [Geoglossum simile]|nr:MAG: hypothetical protein M1840_007723 [Geoglossum simile]
MSGPSTFTINLFHTGDEGAAFRLQRKPGEIQHAHLIQEESELSVKADLFSVLHGTRSPGGDAASLIVIDFLFTGSDSRRRRFREATIDVQFALENDKPGRGLEPVVDKIAPFGAFRMSPSTRVTSTTLSANATISGSGGPVALGIGGGWQETHSLNEEGWATMSGYLRIEGRIDGSCNAARWKLRENEQQKHGIPSSLRIAILLLPKSTQRFRAFVSIDTSVNILSATQQRIKRFLGGGLVDPIYFDEEGRRKPFGPQPVNVDINNLSHCDLGTLNFDGPSGPGPSVGGQCYLSFWILRY